MTAKDLRIDFISDIVCPWCAIGLASLLKALDRIGGEVKADIQFHPFELNPGIAPEGENITAHLISKYNSNEAASAEARQVIRERAAGLGLQFNYTPDSRIWNTADAHRLLHWAGIEGKQLPLKLALFKAYFTDQKQINDFGVLEAVAREAGLDPVRARAILATKEFAEESTGAQMHWRRSGVTAVPMIVFNNYWGLQGGQPPEIFEQAIRDIIAGMARPA